MECNEFAAIKDLALLRRQKKLAFYVLFLYLSREFTNRKAE